MNYELAGVLGAVTAVIGIAKVLVSQYVAAQERASIREDAMYRQLEEERKANLTLYLETSKRLAEAEAELRELRELKEKKDAAKDQ